MFVTIFLAHIGLAIVKIGLALTLGRSLHKRRQHDRSIPTQGITVHWARWYDRLVGLATFGRASNLRRMTVELANIVPGERVLDVGCGTGQLTAHIGQQVGPTGQVIGIDPAAEMVDLARKHFPNVEFQLAAVERMPFDDDSFDVVVSSLVLHHLPSKLKPAALQEIRRVLKPGGRTVHVDFAVGHGGGGSAELLEPPLKVAGFNHVSSGKTSFRPLCFVAGNK